MGRHVGGASAWWRHSAVKQFLITVAGVLVALILFLILAPIGLISFFAAQSANQNRAPEAMVVSIDLRTPLRDQPKSGFGMFGGETAALDIVTKLEAATTDPAVKGIFIRGSSYGMSAAHAEEIRDSLAAFRASGKFVVAHLQNEAVRQSVAGYAAVAGASEVWLHEAGELAPMGIVAETEFLGDTMRRFSLIPEYEQRRDYKNAPNSLTQTGFTPAHRAATESLINGIYDNLISSIATSRAITAEEARAALAATPMTGQQAIERKLFTNLGRPEDAQRRALEWANEGEGPDAEMVDISDYHPTPDRNRRNAPVIALVGGEGGVMTGPDTSSPFSDEDAMLSDVVARALIDAADDEDVKAIVFRVSSPGGSLAASDQIEAAVRYATSRNRPVVVSMGPVAASGGYWVSAQASEIVAQPSTITGSIGIYGGKIVIGEALERFASIQTDRVQVGSALADAGSPLRRFNPEERRALAEFIDRGYAAFLARVAEGRDLTPEQTEEIAQGRVWTGAQAKERRLVDHLGGYTTALARARALAQLSPDEPIQVRRFPAAQSPFEELRQLFGVSAEAASTLATVRTLVGDEALRSALAAARHNEAPVRAEAEPLRVR